MSESICLEGHNGPCWFPQGWNSSPFSLAPAQILTAPDKNLKSTKGPILVRVLASSDASKLVVGTSIGSDRSVSVCGIPLKKFGCQ
jgi:hypothetical protein